MHFRLTKKQRNEIYKRAKASNMNLSEFIINASINNKIEVYESADKFREELRRIGNNINQLTRLANSGIINCIDLSEVKGELKKIWQLLSSLTTKSI